MSKNFPEYIVTNRLNMAGCDCFLVDVSPTNPVIIAGRRKTYIRNRLFSWGAPLIVVRICVALQLTSTGNVAYGEFYTFILLSRAQHYSRVQRPRPFWSTPKYLNLWAEYSTQLKQSHFCTIRCIFFLYFICISLYFTSTGVTLHDTTLHYITVCWQ